MPLSTIKLATTINYATTHLDLLPLVGVGGIADEPGLSICVEAAAEIINDENDWKWNSNELCSPLGLTQGTGQPLIVYQSKQDYLWAGASAFSLNSVGGVGTGINSTGASIDLASNSAVTVAAGVVTVKTLEPHRFAVGNPIYLFGVVFTTGTPSKYNSTITDNGSQTLWGAPGPYIITGVPTSNSFTFAAATGQNNADVGGAPGVSDLLWVTAGNMIELNNNSSPMNVRQLKAVRGLPAWSKLADPEQFAVMKDYGTGVLLIRMMYTPAAVTWIVNMIYQRRPPVYISLNQPWGIPDQYIDVINQAVMYRAYRYIKSASADNEYKKLQAAIQKANGTDQSEESNVFLEPMDSLVDTGPYGVGWGGY